MPFTQLELTFLETAMRPFMAKRRPPPEIRHKVDLSFRFENQSLLIYTIRPVWNDPTRTVESPIAKATFIRSKNLWKVFWMRADLKWHAYPPCPHVPDVAAFLALVDLDDHCCFWG